MVVWLVFSLYPPYTGGAATYSELLVEELPGIAGIRHVVLVTEYHPGRILLRKRGATVLGILPRRDSLAGKNLLWHTITFVITQWIIFWLLLWVAVRRGRHVVHIHNRYIYRWTGIMVGCMRVSAVADVRDRFAKLQALQFFPAVICVSEAVAEQVSSVVPPEHLVHIPIPIDLRKLGRARPSSLPARPYFLYVGRITEQKGGRELIEAYRAYAARYHERIPDLIFVGLNLLPALELEASKGPGVIRFMGSLPREGVYSLIHGADRVILPSREEGLPRACIESIALGVPVVCPPAIAEFERYCPQCVLPEVTPFAILAMLERPRESLIAKDYPIETHDRSRIVPATAAVYKTLAFGASRRTE